MGVFVGGTAGTGVSLGGKGIGVSVGSGIGVSLGGIGVSVGDGSGVSLGGGVIVGWVRVIGVEVG